MSFAWLTPNIGLLSETPDCRVIRIPGSLWYLVNGALSELTHFWKWEQYGTATPDEMAQFFEQVYDDFLNSRCHMIGEIRATVSTETPAGWYELNGQQIVTADHPDFSAICPTSWFDDPTGGDMINLPNMTAHTLTGYGTVTGYSAAIGDQGGETRHTLTISEMPSHQHGYNAVTSGIQIDGELDARDVAEEAGTEQTTSTGGGGPHNNMPPFMAVRWLIYVG